MANKIKALGLAFVAVAAMSAVSASAAQAGSLDVFANPAVITAHTDPSQPEHFLSIPLTAGGTLSAICPTASYEGTVGPQEVGQPSQTPVPQTDITELTVTATYGAGCKLNGLASTVKMNGCKYTITGAGEPAFTAKVDIVGCTAGKQIEVTQTATGCVVTVPEQNGLSHIVFTQKSAQEVTDDVTVTGITFTESAACPNPGHHGANASFTGNTIAKAFVDAGTHLETKHSHQYTEHTCGAQVNLTAT